MDGVSLSERWWRRRKLLLKKRAARDAVTQSYNTWIYQKTRDAMLRPANKLRYYQVSRYYERVHHAAAFKQYEGRGGEICMAIPRENIELNEIVNVHDALQAIYKTGLTRRAIAILLQHHIGTDSLRRKVPLRVIEAVLGGVEELHKRETEMLK